MISFLSLIFIKNEGKLIELFFIDIINSWKLYVVDIKFDHTKATRRQIVYNEIYPPIIEKQKIIDLWERSVYQLNEQFCSTEKGNPHAYRVTEKAHAILFEKKFQPMYFEQLAFAIKWAGWPVTKLYSHNTFE